MKIAILSDTHDNLESLKRILNFLKEKNVEKMIHCGDITTPETLNFIRKSFKGEIFISLGNADLKDKILALRENLSGVFIFENFGEIEIDELKIGFSHFQNPSIDFEKYDFYFFGDTHRPFLKKIKNCYLANPGNSANLYFQLTFAILDTKTKKIELVLVNPAPFVLSQKIF